MSSTLRFPLPSSIINYVPPSHLASSRFCRILNVQFFAKRHLLRLCTVSTNNSVHESADKDKSFVEKPGSMGKDESQQALSPNEIMKRLKRYGTSGILSYGLLNTVYYLTTFLVVWFYVSPAPARMGYLAAVERFLKVMAMVWAGSQVTKLFRAGGYSGSLVSVRGTLFRFLQAFLVQIFFKVPHNKIIFWIKVTMQVCPTVYIGYTLNRYMYLHLLKSDYLLENRLCGILHGRALALAPLVDGGLSWFTVKFNFKSQGKAFMAIAGLCFGLAIMLFLVVTLLCA